MLLGVQEIVLLLAVTTQTLGRRVCTYVEEKETQGSQDDWQGSISVLNQLQCQQFCSSTPDCTAAEFSSSSHSCYLYKGPTTRHHHPHNTFFHRLCSDIPLETATKMLQPTVMSDTPPTSAGSVKQVGRVPSGVHMDREGERVRRSSSTQPAPPQPITRVTTPRGSPPPHKPVKRPASLVVRMLYESVTAKTPQATEFATEMTPIITKYTEQTTQTAKTTPTVEYIPKKIKKKRNMFRKHKKRPRKTKKRLRKIKKKPAHKATVKTSDLLSVEKHKRPQSWQTRTTRTRTTTAITQSWKTETTTPQHWQTETTTPQPRQTETTTPQPRQTETTTRRDVIRTSAAATKKTGTVEISKSIELKIPDKAESLRIRPDKAEKAVTLVKVHMTSKRYPQPVSTQVEESNRVDVPMISERGGAVGCATLCIPRNGVRHTGRGLFLPLMRIHLPLMTPYSGLQGYYSRFRPRIRFRFRQRLSPEQQMPFKQKSPMDSQQSQWKQPGQEQSQWQQPDQEQSQRQHQRQHSGWQQHPARQHPRQQQPQWQHHRRQQPQWQHHRRQQPQWQYPRRQQPQWQQSGRRRPQWRPTWQQAYRRQFHRHPWQQRRGISPQHAAVARYGVQRNPWANNFQRASLRARRTHHVAVIPGGRVQWAHGAAASYRERSVTSPPLVASAAPTSQTVFKSVSNTEQNLTRADRGAIQTEDKLNDEGRPAGVERRNTSIESDEKWQLKPHYNTYLLRLNLPLPISGYKRCYLRQQLPPPPKIIIISFSPDGSFKAKSLPVHYPRRMCTFVRPAGGVPELHLPAPLVIFTGTSFAAGQAELKNIYNATAPKAEYEAERVQDKSNRYSYTAVYNAAPVFRKLSLPIDIASAMIGFDTARMGFIYRFTVRLPRLLSSRNIMVHDQLPANMLYIKTGPKPFLHSPEQT